jgi:hypothetical protein
MTRKTEKQNLDRGEKSEDSAKPDDDGLNGAINAAEGGQANKAPDPPKQAASPTPEDIFNDFEALRKVAEHKVQRRTRPCENPANFCKQSRRAKFFAIFSLPSGLRARKSEQNRSVSKRVGVFTQARTIAVNMPVGKPPDNAYFQCHPDPAQRLDASLLFDKEERDIYFVYPQMMNHPLVAPRLRRATLATTYLWPSGRIILWPVPFPTGKGAAKCWKTTRHAFEIACGLAEDLAERRAHWAQLCWNEELRDYDLAIAENINISPIWPADLNFSTSLKLGFRDKTIADDDHPYMRQLRGLTE